MLYNELEQGDILSGVRWRLALLAYTDILLCSIWAMRRIRQTPDSYTPRGEKGLQVLRDHVIEHRAAGISGCVGSHRWRHTSPHGQQGEKGHAISYPSILLICSVYKQNVTLELWRKHAGRTAVPQQPLCVVRVVAVAK